MPGANGQAERGGRHHEKKEPDRRVERPSGSQPETGQDPEVSGTVCGNEKKPWKKRAVKGCVHMILNRCRGCGCPLDPGERYCEECEEEMLAEEEAAVRRMRSAANKTDQGRKDGKCR